MSVLEVHNVSIRYITGDFKDIGLKEYVVKKLKDQYKITEFWADRDVSFTLDRGEMLGIIGTNGAGKSTLLKAVSGIMEPTRGYVKRQGNIAALLELASGFDGDLTVRENAYLRGAMLGYTREFMDETYDQIIDFAELRDFQDRPFRQLSSGMKSRLAFSIASLVQPDILILDEVLSVGDGAFRKKSEEKMREIIAGGAATILVSHSVAQVRSLCTKVLWLEHGQQIAYGETQKICDAYEDYLATPLKVRRPPADADEIERISKDFRLYQALVREEKKDGEPSTESPATAEQRWMKEIRSWDDGKRETMYQAYGIGEADPRVVKRQAVSCPKTNDRPKKDAVSPPNTQRRTTKRRLFQICAAITVLLLFFLTSNYVNTANEREQQKQIVAVQGLNADEPLALKSVYGDIEATHPKAVSFAQPWNGYRYWISYSPYPKGDDSKENPHIMASNDLEHWEEPAGFLNPLDDTPPDYKKSVVYNSDPELFYNEDTGELECWWRFVDDSNGKKVVLYRRRSADGVNWTEKETMLTADRSKQDWLSPALIYEDGLYKMWSIGSGYRVQYMESRDGREWSDIRFIAVDYLSPNVKNWHIGVIHTAKGYEMVLVSFDDSLPADIYPRTRMSLYYTWSTDNISYKRAKLLLAPSQGENDWDNKGLYRSGLLADTDGQYYLIYSGIKRDGTRGVGLVRLDMD